MDPTRGADSGVPGAVSGMLALQGAQTGEEEGKPEPVVPASVPPGVSIKMEPKAEKTLTMQVSETIVYQDPQAVIMNLREMEYDCKNLASQAEKIPYAEAMMKDLTKFVQRLPKVVKAVECVAIAKSYSLLLPGCFAIHEAPSI